MATVVPFGVEDLPADFGGGRLLALVFDDRGEGEGGGAVGEGGAHDAFPLAEVDGVSFGEPDVAVDAGSFIEPAVAEAGVGTDDDVILRAVVEEVREVETEGGVAVVVAADEAAVDEDEHIANGAVEFDPDATAEIGRGNFKFAAVPADTGLGVATAEGLVTVGLHGVVGAAQIIVNEGELDGPVVGQVEGAPCGVVKGGFSEVEVAGFAEVALAEAEAEIFGGIVEVAEGELPAVVEEELLAGSDGGKGGRRGFGC